MGLTERRHSPAASKRAEGVLQWQCSSANNDSLFLCLLVLNFESSNACVIKWAPDWVTASLNFWVDSTVGSKTFMFLNSINSPGGPSTAASPEQQQVVSQYCSNHVQFSLELLPCAAQIVSPLLILKMLLLISLHHSQYQQWSRICTNDI